MLVNMKDMKQSHLKKSFFEISKFNQVEFIPLLPNKKNIILDFGCGNGCFSKNFTNKKIKQIKMYDKDKTLRSFIKKKYKNNSKISWIESLKSNYNVVLINSVVQYLTLKEYKSLISHFFLKKVDTIIISDVPKFPFYIEGVFCIFTNIKRILISLRYLFQKNYNFYFFKKKSDFLIHNDYYEYQFHTNLNEDKLLRYTIIYKKI